MRLKNTNSTQTQPVFSATSLRLLWLFVWLSWSCGSSSSSFFSSPFPFLVILSIFIIITGSWWVGTRTAQTWPSHAPPDHSQWTPLRDVRRCWEGNRQEGQGPPNRGNRLHVSDILEKAMAPHSSTLAWRIPWMEEPGGLQSMGLRRVRHNWATSLSLFTFMHCRRKWQPTPVFLPGESQEQRSLLGCHLWGCIESDTTDATSLSLFTFMHWRRKWQPTPVFLPGESQGQGSLMGCHLWGRTESDTTEAT